MHNEGLASAPTDTMSKAVLKRNNRSLRAAKVRPRKALQSRSSEAVRRISEERLATDMGLRALQDLQKFGGLEDVFGRAGPRSKQTPSRLCP